MAARVRRWEGRGGDKQYLGFTLPCPSGILTLPIRPDFRGQLLVKTGLVDAVRPLPSRRGGLYACNACSKYCYLRRWNVNVPMMGGSSGVSAGEVFAHDALQALIACSSIRS
ncbi:hypothetical protein E2C01_079030 [Portunus trituberculatus]|uniref:Uncharacterized protein n=1 Tax=Portunus trituberculatus TaxID=210409 RepID=A0A5B7IPI8_PORTR|nr:hypothetical protein [Portunus trituberculatus]